MSAAHIGDRKFEETRLMITFSSVLISAIVATMVVRWVNAGDGRNDPNRPAGA